MTQATGLSSPATAIAMTRYDVGPLSVGFLDGDLRCVTFAGTEILRRLSCPVRDTSWGTLPVETTAESLVPVDGGADYRHRFAAHDGSFSGDLVVRIRSAAHAAHLTADLTIQPVREFSVNRAGFTILHPLRGFADAPLEILHPDGSVEQGHMPRHISPGQTAWQIAGLRHRIGGAQVDISFAGEVFEMEDQRNWSDASFKTYCRPLSLPWPYVLTPGTPVRQTITVRVSPAPAAPEPTPLRPSGPARIPQVGLAHETGISGLAALDRFAALPVTARITPATSSEELAALAGRTELTLELVIDGAEDVPTLAARCREQSLAPRRVVALPRGYLASHQPEGPWPRGPRPDDLIPYLRQAFPGAEAGGGSLTNFTEFNRCRPDAGKLDFVTFGNTAIVHAADDLSVLETLETLPHILASAAALSGGRPVRLGLVSIGMRSNPYGAGVIPNPLQTRLPMAMDDPRQATPFAAAYAVGVLAAAAQHGVAGLCLGMADGPLGVTAGQGLTPLGEVIVHAAGLEGESARVVEDAPLLSLETPRGGFVANLSDRPHPRRLDRPARILGDAAPRREGPGEITLLPFEVALTGGDGE